MRYREHVDGISVHACTYISDVCDSGVTSAHPNYLQLWYPIESNIEESICHRPRKGEKNTVQAKTRHTAPLEVEKHLQTHNMHINIKQATLTCKCMLHTCLWVVIGTPN